MGDPRGGSGPRRARSDGVRARALERARRSACEPGRGRAARDAGHLPERRLRGPPAPVRGGGLRISGGRPDGRQRHGREAHPATRRRRALRCPLRPAALTHAGAGHARGHALAGGRVALARRSGSPREVGAPRLASTASGGGDPLRGAAAGNVGAPSHPVGARGQRAAARTPGRGSACRRRAPLSAGRRARRRACRARIARPPDSGQRPAGGSGHGPLGRGFGGHRDIGRGGRRPRPVHAHLRRPGRRHAGGHQVPGLRLVRGALAPRHGRPGGGGIGRGAPHALGRAACLPTRSARRLLEPLRRRARR